MRRLALFAQLEGGFGRMVGQASKSQDLHLAHVLLGPSRHASEAGVRVASRRSSSAVWIFSAQGTHSGQ